MTDLMTGVIVTVIVICHNVDQRSKRLVHLASNLQQTVNVDAVYT